VDPREDIGLAFEEPDRRTSVTPPPLRLADAVASAPTKGRTRRPRPDTATASAVDQSAPTTTPPGPDPGTEPPGRTRGRLRYLELYLTGRAHELLLAQRDAGQTFGESAMEALRRSRRWLIDTYAPPPPDPDDDFPPPRRSKRRFQVDGGRHVSVGVTDDEAEAVARLAAQVDLNVSQLVSIAVERHFAGDSSMRSGNPPSIVNGALQTDVTPLTNLT